MLKKIKKFMPFRLIIAIPVLVILAAFFWLITGPLMKTAAEEGASRALCTEVSFDAFSVSPFSGTITFAGLIVQDQSKPDENLLMAEKGEGVLSIYELLRGRAVIDKLALTNVKCNVEREEDGSLNIEDLGTPPEEQKPATEAEKKEAEKTDWVETARKAAEKIKQWVEKKQKEEKERQAGGEHEPPEVPAEKLPEAWAEYLSLDEPVFVIRELTIDGLEVDLSDAREGKDPAKPGMPSLTKGRMSLYNLSSNPMILPDPIQYKLHGNFGALGTLGFEVGEVDLRMDKPVGFSVKAIAKGIDLKALGLLCGLSLPVVTESGEVNMETTLSLENFFKVDLTPLVDISKLKLSPLAGHDKLVGIPSKEFCQAVNHAGGLSLNGLHIGGTFSSPEFTWDQAFQESLKKLMVDAGKGYLMDEATKHLNKHVGKVDDALDKVLGDDAGKVKDAVNKVLGDDAGDGKGKSIEEKATDGVKGIIKGAGDLFK